MAGGSFTQMLAGLVRGAGIPDAPASKIAGYSTPELTRIRGLYDSADILDGPSRHIPASVWNEHGLPQISTNPPFDSMIEMGINEDQLKLLRRTTPQEGGRYVVTKTTPGEIFRKMLYGEKAGARHEADVLRNAQKPMAALPEGHVLRPIMSYGHMRDGLNANSFLVQRHGLDMPPLPGFPNGRAAGRMAMTQGEPIVWVPSMGLPSSGAHETAHAIDLGTLGHRPSGDGQYVALRETSVGMRPDSSYATVASETRPVLSQIKFHNFATTGNVADTPQQARALIGEILGRHRAENYGPSMQEVQYGPLKGRYIPRSQQIWKKAGRQVQDLYEAMPGREGEDAAMELLMRTMEHKPLMRSLVA